MGIRDIDGMCEYVCSVGIVRSPLMGGGFDAIFAFLLLGIFLSLFVPWSRSSYEEYRPPSVHNEAPHVSIIYIDI